MLFLQEDSDVDERKKSKIKKSSCNFALLQAWYEGLYFTNSVSNSPKKQKTKNERKVLVVIIPDFESFSEKVLQDFILITRYVPIDNTLQDVLLVHIVFNILFYTLKMKNLKDNSTLCSKTKMNIKK